MKRIKISVLLCLVAFITVGCFHDRIVKKCYIDLTVKNADIVWDQHQRKVKAEIANICSLDAGNFMVYFDGVENPVSNNHRPQVSHNIPGLAGGATITLEADFDPLAHPDNFNLANVYKIRIEVDPKNMVNESNEHNNEKILSLP